MARFLLGLCSCHVGPIRWVAHALQFIGRGPAPNIVRIDDSRNRLLLRFRVRTLRIGIRRPSGMSPRAVEIRSHPHRRRVRDSSRICGRRQAEGWRPPRHHDRGDVRASGRRDGRSSERVKQTPNQLDSAGPDGRYVYHSFGITSRHKSEAVSVHFTPDGKVCMVRTFTRFSEFSRPLREEVLKAIGEKFGGSPALVRPPRRWPLETGPVKAL